MPLTVEHSTPVAEGVHWGVPVIGDYRRCEKTREFETAVAVGVTIMAISTLLITQSSDAPGPFSFSDAAPLKRQAKLGEK